MVFWDGQQLEAPKEKSELPTLAATLQCTVSRVMAEQQYGASGTTATRSDPADGSASRS